MKILVLGGTLFAGRAVVDEALARGHDVTLFNRGRTGPGLFGDEVEHLRGDRNEPAELAAALGGRSFDAVIDPSAYVPRQVRAVVDVLGADAIGHYTFVSSCSVYADHSVPGADESDELEAVEDPSSEDVDAHYGGLKVLSEQALDELLPGRVHHVRAGLIVGPHDNSGRFSYWVDRIAAGGAVLAPEPRELNVQFIDVRDLGRWIVHAAETDVAGALNASGTPAITTMEAMLSEIVATTGSDAQLQWIPENFLIQHDVTPWTELPLWLPPNKLPTHVGFMARSNAKALGLGLEFRPFAETVAATKAWLDSMAGSGPHQGKTFGADLPKAGLSREREHFLLDEWSQIRLGSDPR